MPQGKVHDGDWIALAHAKSKKYGQGCWIWTGSTNEAGYAIVSIARKQKRLHRLVLEQCLERPLILHALHRCGNKLCVNPDHLYEGDDQQNALDVFEAGKVERGWKHHAAKATPQIVIIVSEAKRRGFTYELIGNLLGVSTGTIHNWVHQRKGGRNVE